MVFRRLAASWALSLGVTVFPFCCAVWPGGSAYPQYTCAPSDLRRLWHKAFSKAHSSWPSFCHLYSPYMWPLEKCVYMYNVYIHYLLLCSSICSIIMGLQRVVMKNFFLDLFWELNYSKQAEMLLHLSLWNKLSVCHSFKTASVKSNPL